jgi:polar amino acid transport system substrate-binding protein
MKLKNIVIFSMFFSISVCEAKVPVEVKFASTEWCPYTCSQMKNEGIVTDKIRKILAKYKVQSLVKFLPWKRAITSVMSGSYDALLTAVPSEAPNLKYTTIPTMEYSVCLNTAAKKFKEVQSLKDLKQFQIGVVDGYSYGEPFDTYIEKNKGDKNRILRLSGVDVTARLIKLTKAGRISYFLSDKLVAKFIDKDVKETFCAKSEPFYIGFSPKVKNVEKILKILNRELLIGQTK